MAPNRSALIRSLADFSPAVIVAILSHHKVTKNLVRQVLKNYRRTNLNRSAEIRTLLAEGHKPRAVVDLLKARKILVTVDQVKTVGKRVRRKSKRERAKNVAKVEGVVRRLLATRERAGAVHDPWDLFDCDPLPEYPDNTPEVFINGRPLLDPAWHPQLRNSMPQDPISKARRLLGQPSGPGYPI